MDALLWKDSEGKTMSSSTRCPYEMVEEVTLVCLAYQEILLLPLCVRMWISSELALGQLLLHCGKGQMRSLG